MGDHVSGGSALTRRQLLQETAGVAGVGLAGGLLSACGPGTTASPSPTPTPKPTPLPPPETTTLRFSPGTSPAPCDAPAWLATELLREEGFTEVKWIPGAPGDVSRGLADVNFTYTNLLVSSVDAGLPLVALAGIHTGCIEFWAAPGIASIKDLRGKTYAIDSKFIKVGDANVPSSAYGFFLTTLQFVGMDPAEVNVVELGPDVSPLGYFLDGKSDVAFVAAAGGPLLRRNPKRRGQVILDSTMDKPWSQNYCCLLTSNRDWVRTNPTAAKRATRAILRATDIAARDRAGAARSAIDQGTYKSAPAITLEVLHETLKDLSFDWREFDPEESVRFFALRMRDVKLVKKGPQQIIDEATDLAFMRQLQRELPR